MARDEKLAAIYGLFLAVLLVLLSMKVAGQGRQPATSAHTIYCERVSPCNCPDVNEQKQIIKSIELTAQEK